MKYIFVLFLSLGLVSIQIPAQNLLHYAISTNGERGECLFPEDALGNVVFSSVVSVPFSADSIMMIASEYVSGQNVSDKCVVKCLSSSTRISTFAIQLNIGKQSWGMEYWGTPLFVFMRDASHVKFKCIIEAREGRYKYSLIDFETNRNTIRGEAKNDGQPNIVHWQRVNSLTKERNAYVATHHGDKRSLKEVVFDYNSQIAYEACLYQAEYDAVKRFENGLKKLNFSDEFMDFSQEQTDSETKLKNAFQGRHFSLSLFGDGFFTQIGNYSFQEKPDDVIFDINSYKGFLLAKGNNVYITSGDSHYEQSGAKELIKQIMIDGFWNVVDDVRQSHFVIKYFVNTEGRDKAFLIFTTANDGQEVTLSSHSSSESVNENKQVARTMYMKTIFPLYKKIESLKYPKSLIIFER